jgi:hypothetical protein
MLSLGFAQASGAAMIGTQQIVESDARTARAARVEAFLTRQDVAQQLVAFGVVFLVLIILELMGVTDISKAT